MENGKVLHGVGVVMIRMSTSECSILLHFLPSYSHDLCVRSSLEVKLPEVSLPR